MLQKELAVPRIKITVKVTSNSCLRHGVQKGMGIEPQPPTLCNTNTLPTD
jgi:hypothetical protein